jgi:2'-5' RNA ligase
MSEAGVDDSLHTGSYRPHITLGIWETVPTGAASPRLTQIASRTSAVAVTFRAIGVYPGHPSDNDRAPSVYLTPTITPELRELHEAVHSALVETGTGSMSRFLPGRWEPHCTVAWRLPTHLISAATDIVVESRLLPLSATITGIGLIETPAEIELERFALTA